jgi:hypothetical protein
MNNPEETKAKQKQTVPLFVFIISVIAAFIFGLVYETQPENPTPTPAVTVTVSPGQAQDKDEAQAATSMNTSFGDGIHVVGQYFEAGTYTTLGLSDGRLCLYQWLTSTGQDAAIVGQKGTKGSATVTLVDGEIFNPSNCGTWKKSG